MISAGIYAENCSDNEWTGEWLPRFSITLIPSWSIYSLLFLHLNYSLIILKAFFHLSKGAVFKMFILLLLCTFDSYSKKQNASKVLEKESRDLNIFSRWTKLWFGLAIKCLGFIMLFFLEILWRNITDLFLIPQYKPD